MAVRRTVFIPFLRREAAVAAGEQNEFRFSNARRKNFPDSSYLRRSGGQAWPRVSTLVLPAFCRQ
jgi:hypothetical protein